MTITFNTNIPALGAQRNLNISANAAGSSLSKLSSGTRIPTAKDDAAGLAIGSKLTAEVESLRQASLNAGQAISMLQIADGALGQIQDVLVRMKTLAVQSSSGQLGNTERAILNTEFTSLQSEVTRIAQATNFNGTTLINGGGQSDALLNEIRPGYGATVGVDLLVDTSIVTSGDVFRITYDYNAGGAGNADDTYSLTVRNITTNTAQTVELYQELYDKKGSNDPTVNLTTGSSLDVNFSALGVKVRLDGNFNIDADLAITTTGTPTNGTNETIGLVTNVTFANSAITNTILTTLKGLSGFNVYTGVLQLSLDASGANNLTFNAVNGLRFQVDAAAATGNNTASDNLDTDDGSHVITVYDANSVELFHFTLADSDGAGASGNADGTIDITFPGLTIGQTSSALSTSTTFNFKVGTGTASQDSVSFTLNAASAAALGISTDTIDGVTAANTAITNLNTAINTLSTVRANVGASQSRLNFASSNISVAIENNTAAKSALLDADISQEITTFTSKQVLIQAGVSMLAQANQQPALLLRLLQ